MRAGGRSFWIKRRIPLIPSDDTFQWDLCDFKASCKVTLREHTGKKYKLIPLLDGQEEPFEQKPDHFVKAMIVSTNYECAKKEINEYIKKLEPQHDEKLNYIEEESGKVYTERNSYYNQGDHQEHFFTFNISNTFSKAEIQKIIMEDAVKDLVFLT